VCHTLLDGFTVPDYSWAAKNLATASLDAHFALAASEPTETEARQWLETHLYELHTIFVKVPHSCIRYSPY
jgi:hypothetical protein